MLFFFFEQITGVIQLNFRLIPLKSTVIALAGQIRLLHSITIQSQTKIPKIHLNAKAEKANNHIAFILDLETS